MQPEEFSRSTDFLNNKINYHKELFMYNLKNTELVWRGLTLSNFASSKVKIIQKGNSFMAHRTGFTAKRLGNLLIQAGFKEVRIIHGDNYDLWAIAIAPNQ